jgi:hypothetical protein
VATGGSARLATGKRSFFARATAGQVWWCRRRQDRAKTYIFELLYPNLETQAMFTVPTRASGNTAQSRSLQTSAAGTAAATEDPADFMHHKRLTINSQVTPFATAHQIRSCIVSRLRWIKIPYLSFNSFRSRGGQGLPALITARFNSRIATICRACDLVSPRRLARPPRRPIPARYSRTFFCASLISTVPNHAS